MTPHWRELGEPLAEELLNLSPDQLLGMREGAKGDSFDMADVGLKARGHGGGVGGGP